jgi:hypothetical protein
VQTSSAPQEEEEESGAEEEERERMEEEESGAEEEEEERERMEEEERAWEEDGDEEGSGEGGPVTLGGGREAERGCQDSDMEYDSTDDEMSVKEAERLLKQGTLILLMSLEP